MSPVRAVRAAPGTAGVTAPAATPRWSPGVAPKQALRRAWKALSSSQQLAIEVFAGRVGTPVDALVPADSRDPTTAGYHTFPACTAAGDRITVAIHTTHLAAAAETALRLAGDVADLPMPPPGCDALLAAHPQVAGLRPLHAVATSHANARYAGYHHVSTNPDRPPRWIHRSQIAGALERIEAQATAAAHQRLQIDPSAGPGPGADPALAARHLAGEDLRRVQGTALVDLYAVGLPPLLREPLVAWVSALPFPLHGLTTVSTARVSMGPLRLLIADAVAQDPTVQDAWRDLSAVARQSSTLALLPPDPVQPTDDTLASITERTSQWLSTLIRLPERRWATAATDHALSISCHGVISGTYAPVGAWLMEQLDRPLPMGSLTTQVVAAAHQVRAIRQTVAAIASEVAERTGCQHLSPGASAHALGMLTSWPGSVTAADTVDVLCRGLKHWSPA